MCSNKEIIEEFDNRIISELRHHPIIGLADAIINKRKELFLKALDQKDKEKIDIIENAINIPLKFRDDLDLLTSFNTLIKSVKQWQEEQRELIK